MLYEWEGTRLHYVVEGDGPAILLLHGLGGHAENWLLQRRHLMATHRVLSLDLPGHGRSSGRDIPFADYWRAIEATLDHAGATDVVICGLAVGARAGMAFASRRAERVTGLIVVNTVLHLDAADRAHRLALYDLLLTDGGARRWAEQLAGFMGIERNSAIIRGFLKSAERIDPSHIRRIFREMDSFDQRPELKQISCPVRIVLGTKDLLVPAKYADEMQAEIAHSEIRLFDTGHLPYLEKPIEFNQFLSDFLVRNPLERGPRLT